jgi:hypothetical protein
VPVTVLCEKTTMLYAAERPTASEGPQPRTEWRDGA